MKFSLGKFILIALCCFAVVQCGDDRDTITQNDQNVVMTEEDTTETTVAASLAIIPHTLKFGTLTIGTSSTKSFTVKNSGSTGSLDITAIRAGAGSTNFKRILGTCAPLPMTLGPGESCKFDVRFKPTTPDLKTRSFTVVTAANGSKTREATGGGGSCSIKANAGGPYYGTNDEVEERVHIIGDGTSSFSSVPITEYHWTWGDGTERRCSRCPTAGHYYVSPCPSFACSQTYTVTLWIRNSAGCTDTATTSATADFVY